MLIVTKYRTKSSILLLIKDGISNSIIAGSTGKPSGPVVDS